MNSRLELHEILEDLLGNKNVYFQPPESIKMSYPAIRYNLSDIDIRKADNITYKTKRRYTIILMHKNPDNDIVDKMVNFGMSFDRFYTSDGLNHYAFSYFY